MSTTTITVEAPAATKMTPKETVVETVVETVTEIKTPETEDAYRYADYLPVRDNVTLPPIEPFDFVDRALNADKAKPNLLAAGIAATDLTPLLGTELRGVQLSQLTDAQKDEFALLVAERGVIVLRDQDFKDIGPEKQKAFARSFGPLHTHPTGAHIRGHLEFHNVYLGPDNAYAARLRASRLNTTIYHSDVSYERQPPGLTILTMLASPAIGGDTAWASSAAAYARLSPPLRALLDGLRAEHSGVGQAALIAKDGLAPRRAPIATAHPVVRVHPVTGQRLLFVNKAFTKSLVGLKAEESDALLALLFQHIAAGQDFQVRVRWQPGTVVVWDNRSTTHTPISDYDPALPQARRHGVRLTTLAEAPVGVDGLASEAL